MKIGCLYCGTDCVEHFVYVIGEIADPPSVKVGYTRKPIKRLASIRKKTSRDLRILHKEMVACEFKAMDIEQEAHRILRPHWVGVGEWFSCPPGTAIEAIAGVIAKRGREAERQ